MRLKSFQWFLRRLLGSKTSCSTKTARFVFDLLNFFKIVIFDHGSLIFLRQNLLHHCLVLKLKVNLEILLISKLECRSWNRGLKL